MVTEKNVTDLINHVSHELKNPLASIKEAVSVVAEGVTGPLNEKQRHFLETAVREVERLTKMTGDLLNLARLEEGRVVLHQSSQDISSIIDSAVTSFVAVATKNGLKIETCVDDGIPSVFVDPDQVLQVLANLLSNAVKFSPGGCSVGVKCELADDLSFVKISVSDSGPGVSKKDQVKLFQRFGQIQTDGYNKLGTGLGLLISKEIVEKHGGSIWIESEEDKGAKFSFTVPVYVRDKACEDIRRSEKKTLLKSQINRSKKYETQNPHRR